MHDFELNLNFDVVALDCRIVDIIICQNVSHKVATTFYFCGNHLRTQPYTVQFQHTISQKLGMSAAVAVNFSISLHSRLNVWQIRPSKTKEVSSNSKKSVNKKIHLSEK